jgi:hypothetical protein
MDESLNILWTTGNENTSLKMVLMYALNSKLKGWWEKVNLVIWGDSARLVAENITVQKHLKDVMDAGVKVEACKACSEQLGVTKTLEQLGVDVKCYGELLTRILKKSGHLITI